MWGDIIERDDIPLDAPKIVVQIKVNPEPYAFSIDSESVINYNPTTYEVYDEIVVEIVSKGDEEQKTGGPRGNTYTYTFIQYEGKLIENLTSPNSIFEYE